MPIKKKSLEERLLGELLAMKFQQAPPAVVEFVVDMQSRLHGSVDIDWLSEWSGWSQTGCRAVVDAASPKLDLPDSPTGRLFQKWLDESMRFRGKKVQKRKWTLDERRKMAQALELASEEDLTNMVEWAFRGDDFYAACIQGKRAFRDGEQPQEYLGIGTLFKDRNLDKRIALAEKYVFKRDAAKRSEASEDWLVNVAMPKLHELAPDPDSYPAAYEWWAMERGRHPDGPMADGAFAAALTRLAQWRAQHGK